MRYVIWLTGLSGSGKTTLGLRIAEELRKAGKGVAFVDGETARGFFEDKLGFDRRSRIQNVKRIAFAASLLAGNNVTAIVANIAPYYEVRDFIRKHIPKYIQVYCKASFEECAARDTKGHYLNAAGGKMKNLIGMDEPYDLPRSPDIIVDTVNESVDESVNKILKYLKENIPDGEL